MGERPGTRVTRRGLFRMIGAAAGGAAMYQAMSALGHAAESPYRGPVALSGAPRGARVLVLGAGIAGLVAAYELRNAGYRVQVLEYADRPGGRNWTLRGGDRYTELGGATQECGFDPGLYLNPGPWRIPYHHQGVLSYCARLGVALEPFVQVNHNAYLHSTKAFGGRPQRLRTVQADFGGHVAELLAKATRAGALDAPLTKEDREKLLAAMQFWGALDKEYRYVRGPESAGHRGYDRPPGGGLKARPEYSEPVGVSELLQSQLWQQIGLFQLYEFQTTLFQPVGGMDRISQAFAREVGDLIRYRARVVDIAQDERGVRVAYEDLAQGGARATAEADWCVCTIPLSILSQIPLAVGPAMQRAVAAVPYAPSIKVGLQFKRRFWEQDEQIYGGLTFTDLPIGQIAYPSSDFLSKGKGVLLGAYVWDFDKAMELTSMAPADRIANALDEGRRIHPQYDTEFDNGIAVAWHRVPGAMGCFGLWSEERRAEHYDALCAVDGRIVLAGEHASYLPAWQEGAVTSALDAIERLHRRAVETGARA
jgi:monoamine oxidase